MKSFQKGNSSLSFCIGVFSKRWDVLIPFGEGHRYDLGLLIDGSFKKVQVKTCRFNKDKSVLIFNICSSPGGKGSRNYANDVDFFGVCCLETEVVYLIPVGVLPTAGKAQLRVKPAKNNQIKGVLFAKDYQIG